MDEHAACLGCVYAPAVLRYTSLLKPGKASLISVHFAACGWLQLSNINQWFAESFLCTVLASEQGHRSCVVTYTPPITTSTLSIQRMFCVHTPIWVWHHIQCQELQICTKPR